MTTIYCDEAGNTGANLLDPDQPFFILASNDFSTEEAVSLLEHVRLSQGGEPKFTTLRRRSEGVRRLIKFLTDPRVNGERVFTDTYHKKYMVVTKMVDLVAETLIHDIGGDLYERGANIAMSNVLYHCMPAFCGKEITEKFLFAFVQLIRFGSIEHKADFYRAGRELLDACTKESFKSDLFVFTEPALFDRWYRGFDWSALDPAIPALFNHIATWGGRKQNRFDVLHDQSKPVLATQADFESMMALTGENSETIGYDRRKIQFPLRALSLSQGDSSNYPQLQVADLCAGILNHYYKCLIANEWDELAVVAKEIGYPEWGPAGLLPSLDVTPESLGTEARGGTNSVEKMTEYLMSRSQRR